MTAHVRDSPNVADVAGQRCVYTSLGARNSSKLTRVDFCFVFDILLLQDPGMWAVALIVEIR